MNFRVRIKQDQGESLIELIVAILIMGLAGVAITVGLTLSAKVSDIHRKEANATALVRDYAEWLQNVVATPSGYVSGTGSYPAYTVPTAYSGYTVSVTSKKCWTSPNWVTCTAGNDIGVQQLTIRAQAPDARATEDLVIVLRKVCTTTSELAACP